jgi:O-antigen/teichoic acid export membrane protein
MIWPSFGAVCKVSETNVTGKIARNAAMLTAASIFCKAIQFIFFLVLLKELTQETFGAFNFYIEAALIIAVLSDLGIENLLVRELSRRRDNNPQTFVRNLFGLRLTLLFIGVAALAAFLLLIRPEGEGVYIALTCTYAFLVSVLSFMRGILRAYESMGLEAIINMVDKCIHVGIGIWVVYSGLGLEVLLFGFCLSSAISICLGGYWILRGICPGSLVPRYGDWKGLLAMGWSFALVAICIALVHRQDTIMVGAIIGDTEVAKYNNGYRLLEGLFLIPQILTMACYPAFSIMFQRNLDMRQRLFSFLRLLWLASLPIAVGGAVLAPQILGFIDEKALISIDLLRILLCSYPFICGNFMVGTLLASTNRQHRNLIAGAWTLGINTVLNVLLILKYGATGAAWATLLSQAVYLSLMVRESRDMFSGWMSEVSYYLRVMIVAAIMGATVTYATYKISMLALLILIGMLVYIIIGRLFRIYTVAGICAVWDEVRHGPDNMRDTS